MKKFKKLLIIVALVLCACLPMPMLSQIANVANADVAGETFSYLTIERFESEANVGAQYTIATAKVTTNNKGVLSHSTEGVTVEVVNPFGENVEVSDNKFDVEYVGAYNVIYKWNGFSQKLKVVAEEGKYTFDFKENVKQIIPDYVNIEKYEGKIVLPNPSIKNEEGEEVNEPNIVIEVLTPSGSKLNNEKLVKNEEGFYEFKADVIGIYTISYLYKSADGKVLATHVEEFTANNTFNNDYKLTYSYNSTLPTTAVTNVETVLPTVVGKNATTNDAVDVYYEISAKRISYNSTSGKVVDKVDVTNEVIDGNKFTPNEDGDYIITYDVKNFFGTTAESSIFEIKGVKDSSKPVVRFVSPYDVKPEEDDNQLNNLFEKHDTKNLVFPAIWADDNVSTTLEDLTLTRKIVKSNGDVVFESSENPNKELILNYNEETAQFTFDSNTQVIETLNENVTMGDGVYNVIYIAEDKEGNISESATYKFILDGGFVDDENPEVKWSESDILPAQTRVGDTISFLSPTATDNVDTRIEIKVEYVFVSNSEPQEEDWNLLEAKNGEYEIKVVDANELRIRAIATDTSGRNSQPIIATIDIIDTNDLNPTQISKIQNVDTNIYKQGNEITLNTITYEDDFADYVKTGIYVYNSENKLLNTYDAQYDITYGEDENLDEIVVQGAKFLASYSGEYTVAYVSKDLKNNYTIYFNDGIEVAPYTETVEVGFTALPTMLNGGTMELGETIKMPAAEITASEDATTSYIVRQISGPTSEDTILNKFEFKPALKGIYEIQYYATVTTTEGEENVEKTFTVEVTDKTAPVIGEIYVEPVVALNYTLTIPQFTASDLSGIDVENSKVVLSSKSYGSKTIEYGDLTSNRTVTLKYNEVYTLKFTAQDIYGNTSTVSKEIKVGDTEAPVIEINENDKKLIPSTVNVGDTLTIDLSLINVSDLVDTEISKEDLIIKLTRDNQEIENKHGDSKTNYEYKISIAGTYKLSISIKDAAGNESEAVTRTFTVNADSNSGVDKNEVVGIILLVISILLLAGVVVYFIVSKKKSDRYKG